MDPIYDKVRIYAERLKTADVRQIADFNEGWCWTDDAPTESARWHPVTLPHDYSVRQGYDRNAPSGLTGGYVKTGRMWYRKEFSADAWRDKLVHIHFDGAASNSRVYINGHFLGLHPYPFTPFWYDLTPYLKFGQTNTVLVLCDTSDQPYSRFYIGTGLTRRVYLTVTGSLFIEHGTLFARTAMEGNDAHVTVTADIMADAFPETVFQPFGELTGPNVDVTKTCELVCEVEELDGETVCTGQSSFAIENYDETSVRVDFTFHAPRLWSVEEPNLYLLHAKLICDGRPADDCRVPLGIRTLGWDAAKGFFLNGEPIKLKGICTHQDIHAFGSAAGLDAWVTRLLLLKEMGCNAIRTAHHPFPETFYCACDCLGFTVMDEAFDEWTMGWGRTLARQGKNEYGYYQYFDQWFETDLRSMITRDRNFPSVVMYSFGNEIPELYCRKSEGILRRMQAIAKELDNGRPTTVALEGAFHRDFDPVSMGLVDISGFNYIEGREKEQYYARIHREHPDYVLLGTETGAHPEHWFRVRDNDYVLGQYIWTAFDYLGEAVDFTNIPYTPTLSEDYMKERQAENTADGPLLHGWPNSMLGITGTKKADFYLRKALWSQEPVVKLVIGAAPKWSMALPVRMHYNWQEGQTLPVWMITNCEEIVLKQNGREICRETVTSDRRVPQPVDVAYLPGTLELIGYRDGKEAARDVLRTAGAAAAIRVVPNENAPVPGAYLELGVEITDENGTVLPYANDHLEVETAGCSCFAMVSDDLRNSDCHDTRRYRVFEGRCKVILRVSEEEPCRVRLRYGNLTLTFFP